MIEQQDETIDELAIYREREDSALCAHSHAVQPVDQLSMQLAEVGNALILTSAFDDPTEAGRLLSLQSGLDMLHEKAKTGRSLGPNRIEQVRNDLKRAQANREVQKSKRARALRQEFERMENEERRRSRSLISKLI